MPSPSSVTLPESVVAGGAMGRATTERTSVVFMMSHSAAGGILEIWTNIAEGLRRRGYDARVCALYPDPFTDRTSATAAGLSHIVEGRPRSARARTRFLSDLVRFFRTEPPDVAVTAMPAANVLVPTAARIAGATTRVIVTHHTPVETYDRVLAAADRWTGRLRNVQAVVTVSDAVGASLDGYPAAYRRKRRTIHNALPPHIEAMIGRIRAGRPAGASGRRCVIATGRLAAQKNYPTLLRAAVHMPGVGIEILGAGPDEAALRVLARDLGIESRVRFCGQVPRELALERLAAADVFAQPSLFEGHSLGLIEAANLHLPLVVSNAPVQVEGVTATDGTRCGTVVDTLDDVALARAITALLDDPTRYAEAVAASAHLAASRTYEAMISAYEALIRPNGSIDP